MIADYTRRSGYAGVVCFSCGNASRALKEEGLDVVDVSPNGELLAGQWWDAARIRRSWPDRLDATSGHLALPLMLDVARAFRGHLGNLWTGKYHVPTGSGETIVCLSMAYPNTLFIPVYGDEPSTTFCPEAPLNDLVEALSGTVNRPVQRMIA